MNVWIVNPFDNLPGEGNRPQRYWLLARAFVAAGHRVTLWTSDFSHATKAKRVLVAPPDPADGFEVVQLPTLPYPANVCLCRLRSHRRLACDFERAAKGRLADASSSPGLVIASTPPLGLCAAALRVARAAGARFACDIQDAWPETFVRLLPCGLKWLGHLLFAPMYRTARRLYRDADVVSGVCTRYARLSGRDDFILAYLGIAGGGSSLPLRADCAREPSRLVYLGNLGSGYDLTTVLAAVAADPALGLDIAGSGPFEGALRAEVARLGLDGRVHFHGYLSAAGLDSLLAQCDVGVIPMRDDSWVGIPNKLCDYLRSGLRVVSSLHGECGALLERTRFGATYDLGSPDSLLAAIRRLPRNVAVSLPSELAAERIYPEFAQHLLS